jgi:hypothetical protein
MRSASAKTPRQAHDDDCAAASHPGLCYAAPRTIAMNVERTCRWTKDAPLSRAVQVRGRIAANPVLGGLQHQYFPNLSFR